MAWTTSVVRVAQRQEASHDVVPGASCGFAARTTNVVRATQDITSDPGIGHPPSGIDFLDPSHARTPDPSSWRLGTSWDGRLGPSDQGDPPAQCPSRRSGPAPAVAWFQAPRLDPERETLALRLDAVPGLMGVTLNGHEIAEVAPGGSSLLVPLGVDLPARNQLILEAESPTLDIASTPGFFWARSRCDPIVRGAVGPSVTGNVLAAGVIGSIRAEGIHSVVGPARPNARRPRDESTTSMDLEREQERKTYDSVAWALRSSRCAGPGVPDHAGDTPADVRRPGVPALAAFVTLLEVGRRPGRLGEPRRDVFALGPLGQPELAAEVGPAGRDGGGRRRPLADRARRRSRPPDRRHRPRLVPRGHRPGARLGRVRVDRSLSCEILVHLGLPQAAETGKATRSLAGTGAIVWMLFFCEVTNWHVWPLAIGRFSLASLLLMLGSTMIFTITLIQVTALTIATTRQCSASSPRWTRRTSTMTP